MLTAGPALANLQTFADTSDLFIGPASVVEEVQKRLYNDEARSLLPVSRLASCFLMIQYVMPMTSTNSLLTLYSWTACMEVTARAGHSGTY